MMIFVLSFDMQHFLKDNNPHDTSIGTCRQVQLMPRDSQVMSLLVKDK